MANIENGTAPAASTTLTFRRNHPGGGVLGRVSYGLAGVAGIVVFDLGMFPNGVAPATITIDCAMVAPTVRKVAGVTSAVVATANVAATQAAQAPAIATPAQVATTAQAKAAEVVAVAGAKAPKGKAVKSA